MRYKHSSNEEGKCFHLGLIYYSRYESCQEIRALFLLYVSLSSRRVNRMIESVDQGSEKGCRSDQTAYALFTAWHIRVGRKEGVSIRRRASFHVMLVGY